MTSTPSVIIFTYNECCHICPLSVEGRPMSRTQESSNA